MSLTLELNPLLCEPSQFVINKASTARGTLTLLMSAQKSTEREIFTTFCPISIRIRREVMHHLSLEFDVDGDDDTSLREEEDGPNSIGECSHQYSHHSSEYLYLGSVYPLSVMYEILRRWKMPELYGN